MPGTDQKEVKKDEPGAAPSPEKERGTAEKPSVAPSAQARAEEVRLKGQIETEKASRIQRQNLLKDECTKRRTKEGWVGNQPDEGLTASMAKGVISDSVDEKFGKYQSQFEANGLGDAANVNTIKQAAKDIVYDHFIKTGNDKDKTTAYAENQLEGKMTFLFNELQRIYASKIYPFEKPADCLAMFSEFTGLNFFSNGSLNLGELKNTLLLERSDYDFFLKNYEQYLNMGAELNKLKSDEENLGKGKPEEKPAVEATALAATPESKAATKPPAGAPEAAGQDPSAATETSPAAPPETSVSAPPEGLVLKDKARILITASAVETEAAIRKAVYEQLPANIDPKARDEAADRLVAEAKKLDAQAGETIEIGTDGTWRKVDVAKEEEEKRQQQPEGQTPAPETQSTPAAEQSAAEKTGFEKFFDKIGKFFEKIMGYVNALLVKMGIAEAPEFSSLNDSEKKEAEDLKKAAEKAGLNMETLHPLFMDAEQTTKILKEKKDKKLSWEDYLKKYLTAGESDELKKKQDLKADKLAEMFITPAAPPQAAPDTQTSPPSA